MKLFLIRHGETVDNVAGIYAGVRDSALTNHGVLQASRLGQHLQDTGEKISHIFSSDLQRAFKTAEAIRKAQVPPLVAETQRLQILRERDFGFYEGKRFIERPVESSQSGKEAHAEAHRDDPGFQDVESKDAMKARSDKFVTEHLLELLDTLGGTNAVVVVAHGVILSHLWRAVHSCFESSAVSVASGVLSADRFQTLEHLGGWANTGYLELELKRPASFSALSAPEKGSDAVLAATKYFPDSASPKPLKMQLMIKAVNSQEHLKGLKKTRGGIGSSKHDEGQKTIESFFKRRRLD